MQANLALVSSSTATQTQTPRNPTETREPFEHQALAGLKNLSAAPIGEVLTKERLATLARTMGMAQIIRWQPRMVRSSLFVGNM
jgi:large subunit ribosomal protein L15